MVIIRQATSPNSPTYVLLEFLVELISRFGIDLDRPDGRTLLEHWLQELHDVIDLHFLHENRRGVSRSDVRPEDDKYVGKTRDCSAAISGGATL